MNEFRPGGKALADFVGRGNGKQNSHWQEPIEPVPPDADAGEASDRCGRAANRGLIQGVILELPDGNREGVFYGSILGRVRFDPSRGIAFVFEDAEGMWKVTITGHDLHGLHRDLVLGRRESVRYGEYVNGIEITAWTQRK